MAQEALARASRRRRTVSIAVSVLGLSVFAAVVLVLSLGRDEQPADHAIVSVVLCNDVGGCSAPDETATAALQEALEEDDDVHDVAFESPELALERLTTTYAGQPDLLTALEEASLPGSFLVSLESGRDPAGFVVRHAGALGVDEVTVLRDGAQAVDPSEIEAELQARELEVVLFLCDDDSDCPAATEDDRDRIVAAMEDDPDVADVEYLDEQATYARGLERFADDPEILDILEPGLLPESVRVRATPDADVDALRARAADLDGVDVASFEFG